MSSIIKKKSNACRVLYPYDLKWYEARRLKKSFRESTFENKKSEKWNPPEKNLKKNSSVKNETWKKNKKNSGNVKNHEIIMEKN